MTLSDALWQGPPSPKTFGTVRFSEQRKLKEEFRKRAEYCFESTVSEGAH